MKNSLTTHLYQYKNSSNYFFRIRRGFFRSSRYHVNKGYFIASLQTACVREAKWLAAFIRMEFEKEMENEIMMFIPKISNTAMGVTCEPCDGDLALPYDNELHETMQVDAICAVIRQRFDELLIKGKSLIKMGVGSNADFQIDLEENDIESIMVSDKSKSEAQQIIRNFTQQDISIPNFPGSPTRLLQECLRTNQRVMSALIELERTRQGLS